MRRKIKIEAHRQSLTQWTNRAFLQKGRTLSCSKQGSSDMPAILLLKDEAIKEGSANKKIIHAPRRV